MGAGVNGALLGVLGDEHSQDSSLGKTPAMEQR
jgi:hypothetical protein